MLKTLKVKRYGAWLLAVGLLGVGLEPARAQSGRVSQEAVAACVDDLLRKVPTWTALRKFRGQMASGGFTAQFMDQGSDPKNGRQWTRYRVMTPAEKTPVAIACESAIPKTAVPAQTPGAAKAARRG